MGGNTFVLNKQMVLAEKSEKNRKPLPDSILAFEI
jgi:hypothetical protein